MPGENTVGLAWQAWRETTRDASVLIPQTAPHEAQGAEILAKQYALSSVQQEQMPMLLTQRRTFLWRASGRECADMFVRKLRGQTLGGVHGIEARRHHAARIGTVQQVACPSCGYVGAARDSF